MLGSDASQTFEAEMVNEGGVDPDIGSPAYEATVKEVDAMDLRTANHNSIGDAYKSGKNRKPDVQC